MSGGGSKPGERRGGRKAGSKNKRTIEREQAMQEAARGVEEALPDAFEGNALALLMAVYKDKTLPLETRMDAAKAAVRFETPPLGAIEPNRSQTQHGKGPPPNARVSTGNSGVDEIVNRFNTALKLLPTATVW